MRRLVRFASVAMAAAAAAVVPLALTPAVAAASSCTGTALFTSYFNWFDNASPGMVADNIHILNPGATPSSGCVTVTGHPGVAWTAGAGKETYLTMPSGTIGGPVTVIVTSGPAVKVSERVQYYSSFHELWAMDASQAATTSYFTWFDKLSAGTSNDNIHVLNPGSVAANVTVAVTNATSQIVSVGPGAEAWVTFPQGTYNGPVTVTSDQPVLVSERVHFYQSFDEIWARTAAQAATKSFLNWFDRTSPGMAYDYIYVLNLGTVAANVVVSDPCMGERGLVDPGHVVGFTIGNGCLPTTTSCIPCQQYPAIDGPVTVSSDQLMLASQRVQYYSSFSEIWALPSSEALTTSYFNWYDKASPGMTNDNIHLTNLGNVNAVVTVTVAGNTPQTVTISSRGYVSFPGVIGGPVTVSSTQPMLASQRVHWYSSFSEVWSG